MRLRGAFLLIRLICNVLLAALLTIHVKSLRVFRWEQSVSGGVIVTYGLAMLGLVLDAGLGLNIASSRVFQSYISSSGMVLLCVNAVGIYRRWKGAGELTRVVAELLGAMGVPLRRQVMTKVYLCASAACVLFLDLTLSMLMMAGVKSDV